MDQSSRQGQSPVMVSLIDRQAQGCFCITLRPRNLASAYTYMEQPYQVRHFPIALFSEGLDDLLFQDRPAGDNAPCPLPDVILLAWDARYAEQGLGLLSRLTKDSLVKDHAIPIVFCLTHCGKLKTLGISIDFNLLEDVLQLPVVPCFNPHTAADDVKAAIAYARKRRFSYDCLDFSPGKLADETISFSKSCYGLPERLLDKGFSCPCLGPALCILSFLALFYPAFAAVSLSSEKLIGAFFQAEYLLAECLAVLRLPPLFADFFLRGIFLPLACVFSAMLPSLVLSMPLFFLFEESGFLPRFSFHADPMMTRCGGCGKQCAAMAMGAHCHMAGVPACRALEGKTKRLPALLANTLLPCGGRIPALLILFSLSLTLGRHSPLSPAAFPSLLFPEGGNPGQTAFPLFPALLLPGILAALSCTFLLSATIFKGQPSFFLLELPALSRPLLKPVLCQAGDFICFLLGKAAMAAIPAGILIWCLGHTFLNGLSLLTHLASLLDPAARLIGLDGVLLAAFLLGCPANELTWPLSLAIYLCLSGKSTAAFGAWPLSPASGTELASFLAAWGWNRRTALSAFVLTLFHCPCLPALSAIRRESGSWKWAAAAALIPTLLGLSLCLLINHI